MAHQIRCKYAIDEQAFPATCFTLGQHEEHKAAFLYLKTHTFVKK
ncbi:hypothetical protein [Egbenema bharatensis]